MRAVVQDRYGPPEVLRIEEVERPVPKDDEVLIRVRAATVSQSDVHVRAASPFLWRLFFGLRRPRWRTLGVDLAGEVEAVGAAVSEFKVGDAVFGSPSSFFGTHADYVCVRERGALAHKPAGLSFKDAAAELRLAQRTVEPPCEHPSVIHLGVPADHVCREQRQIRLVLHRDARYQAASLIRTDLENLKLQLAPAHPVRRT